MNINKQLRAWLDLGVCRGLRLAQKMGCSRQYVESVSKMKKGISPSKRDEIYMGMILVEEAESKDRKKIEQNIIGSARLSHSQDAEIKNYALGELDKWVEALGRAA